MEEKINTPRPLIFVGIISIIVALLGIAYNVSSLSVDFNEAYSELNAEYNLEYFHTAFITMSAICLTLFTALIITGIQLIRGKSIWAYTLLIIIIIEIIYYLALSRMWLHPTYGTSIGAATGIANGGLVAQVIILFPIWAPILAIITHKNSNKEVKRD